MMNEVRKNIDMLTERYITVDSNAIIAKSQRMNRNNIDSKLIN